MHDPRAATDALLLLYRRQEECALVHGCRRETCVIQHKWPGKAIARDDAAGWRLLAFIALAFGGPPGSA
jgi:hypothetical protein